MPSERNRLLTASLISATSLLIALPGCGGSSTSARSSTSLKPGELRPGPAGGEDATASVPTTPAAPAEAVEPLDTARWPAWRGPQRDGTCPDARLPARWPTEKLPLLWSVGLGGGYSSPVFDQGLVVSLAREGNQEVVRGHDLATGKVFWQYAYATPYTAHYFAAKHGAGPKSTPAIHDGKVYTLSILEVLHCLDAKTGKVVWKHDFPKEFGTPVPQYGACTSPLAEGDRVYVPAALSIVAMDKSDGRIVWKADVNDDAYSSLITADFGGVHQLVAFTRSQVAGLDPQTGAVRWKHAWTADFWRQNIATPVVWNDLVILTGLSQGTTALRIRRAEGGEQPAERGREAGAAPRATVLPDGPASARPTPPAAPRLQVQEVWHNRALRGYMSSPALHDGHLYGLDESGQLVCLDAATGRQAWGHGNFGDYASLVRCGEVLLMLNETGELTVIKPTPAGYEEQATLVLSQAETWAHLAVAGNRLWVRDAGQLSCFELPDRAPDP